MEFRTVTDVELAAAVAEEAGDLLLAIRARGGATGKALGDAGDAEANRLILDRLRRARPDDFILSEESLDDGARCAARRVWIVDPLDGTRDYADGLDDWAVHVGLAIDGRPAVGAVAVPTQRRVYTTAQARQAASACGAPPRMVVSRTRASSLVHQVGAALAATHRGMGSAGVKAMAVVDGRADIYLHDGGQYEWDNCAPAAVALAAGLHASRIDGSPLVYNCADPLLPDLLICRPELAEQVLAAVAAIR
ncbi:3'(2'),5'-bisphosphate nucleotidase CysQ [Sphingomonas sp. MA1305]|uniref:3'(2'),5'-bisphosphate nucleotidase CysQ n=1 Tax=Sphingomonas sp. MA1305 TaxID=2479204 RepID=UPI0018DFAC38|nr:3'(2'),5'-bisphosphate nucleotidase CysQ [Sphingomonas sp. MA1305]MBI0474984.1 3'(2'),5'-bisphosphate nucleotidase CysQ [Sphingomonas sp. MA1305]